MSGRTDPVDLYLARLDGQGRLLWTTDYNSPEKWHERPARLRLGLDGSLYVTALVQHPQNFGQFYLVLRYANDGQRLWAARYDTARSRGWS
jgi:hypothetical protein